MTYADVFDLVQQHERWRRTQTINLIASENVCSQRVTAIQASDLAGRVAEGVPGARFYRGAQYLDRLEVMALQELGEMFGARYVDIRPLSGYAANTAVALGWLQGGDTVLSHSVAGGGHISHNKMGVVGRRIQARNSDIQVLSFPLMDDGYHIDLPKTYDLIAQHKPRLVIVGKTLFLFPEPLCEIVACCDTYTIPVLYDAAHVLGLLAGGLFQDPLTDGATWVSASTHKTFPGPLRGLLLSNTTQEAYWQAVMRGIFPGSTSTHGLNTIPALLLAVREMRQYAVPYATQMVRNAQVLAGALDACGLCVEAKDFGYTQSHMLAVNTHQYGGGNAAAALLEQQDIIVNANMLPHDTSALHPSGIRIGVQEMTRWGMQETDMWSLAILIKDALDCRPVKEKVHVLRQQFQRMEFC